MHSEEDKWEDEEDEGAERKLSLIKNKIQSNSHVFADVMAEVENSLSI